MADASTVCERIHKLLNFDDAPAGVWRLQVEELHRQLKHLMSNLVLTEIDSEQIHLLQLIHDKLSLTHTRLVMPASIFYTTFLQQISFGTQEVVYRLLYKFILQDESGWSTVGSMGNDPVTNGVGSLFNDTLCNLTGKTTKRDSIAMLKRASGCSDDFAIRVLYRMSVMVVNALPFKVASQHTPSHHITSHPIKSHCIPCCPCHVMRNVMACMSCLLSHFNHTLNIH